jgi:predicted  nucleic acid-binding Zn-ribbon protein
MPKEPSSLVLAHLRKIDRNVGKLVDDMSEVKTTVVALDGHMANFHVQTAGHSAELDRIKARLDRIERRLELSEV